MHGKQWPPDRRSWRRAFSALAQHRKRRVMLLTWIRERRQLERVPLLISHAQHLCPGQGWVAEDGGREGVQVLGIGGTQGTKIGHHELEPLQLRRTAQERLHDSRHAEQPTAV